MRYLVLLFTLTLSACSTTSINANYAHTAASWRWASASQLLKVWGTPNNAVKLANGNKVFIYEKESYKNYPAPSVTSAVATVTVAGGRNFVVVPSPTYTTTTTPTGATYLLSCSTYFEIDPHNIIVDVRAKGNNCTADQSFVFSKSNPGVRKREVEGG